MTRLGDVDLLTIWERGCAQHGLDRAITSLAVATGEPATALAELALGERDARLFAIYRRTFGARIGAVAACPSCEVRVETELDADQLCPAGHEQVVAGEIVVEQDGVTVVCRQPTSRDLARAATAASLEDARAALFAACVIRAIAGDDALAADAIPVAVVAHIEQALADMEPPAERALTLTCPACGRAWSAPFDIADALWSMVDARARRLMETVAALAERYGWSEADVLALPPARRRYYLERAS